MEQKQLDEMVRDNELNMQERKNYKKKMNKIETAKKDIELFTKITELTKKK